MSGIRGGAGSTGGSTGGVTGGVTIGVEEEFHLVDPDTGDLVPAARRVLGRGDGEAVPELQRTVVETATGVHTTLDGLRHDLLARRRELAAAAGEVGLVVVAAGTVPASGARTSTVFPDRRYEWMAAEYRQLVDEQQVCACQVHVGVAGRHLAVHVTRRIRAWLPVLLAIITGGKDIGVLQSDQRSGFPAKKNRILLAQCIISGIIEHCHHHYLSPRHMTGKIDRAQLPVSEQALKRILPQCFPGKLIFAYHLHRVVPSGICVALQGCPPLIISNKRRALRQSLISWEFT